MDPGDFHLPGVTLRDLIDEESDGERYVIRSWNAAPGRDPPRAARRIANRESQPLRAGRACAYWSVRHHGLGDGPVRYLDQYGCAQPFGAVIRKKRAAKNQSVSTKPPVTRDGAQSFLRSFERRAVASTAP